jgi:hypothetical protein
MRAMNRECPFRGCGKRIPSSMFSCTAHWYKLTKAQQTRIYACYGAWKAGRLDGEALRREQAEVLAEVEGVGHAQA